MLLIKVNSKCGFKANFFSLQLHQIDCNFEENLRYLIIDGLLNVEMKSRLYLWYIRLA